MCEQTAHADASGKLVSQVKDKCRITWDDDATNRHVEELVSSAVAVVGFKIGVPEDCEFDWSAPSLEHRLVLNWCYYAWHDQEDEFWRCYAQDIAQARRIWEVNNAQRQKGSADLS